MSVRTQISAMVFLMVQAVLFGAGLLAILLTPLRDHAMIAARDDRLEHGAGSDPFVADRTAAAREVLASAWNEP